MAKEDKLQKKSSFTRISFERDLVLTHHLSQRLHKRFYDTLDHVLFVSTKILRAQHRDEESQRIEEAVRCLCEKMEVDIKTESERLLNVAKANNVPQIHGNSDKESSIKAEFSTGCSLRILDLFSRFDQLLMIIESLEIHNTLSCDECSKLIRFWSGEFRHFLVALLGIRNKFNDKPKEEKEDASKR